MEAHHQHVEAAEGTPVLQLGDCMAVNTVDQVDQVPGYLGSSVFPSLVLVAAVPGIAGPEGMYGDAFGFHTANAELLLWSWDVPANHFPVDSLQVMVHCKNKYVKTTHF